MPGLRFRQHFPAKLALQLPPAPRLARQAVVDTLDMSHLVRAIDAGNCRGNSDHNFYRFYIRKILKLIRDLLVKQFPKMKPALTDGPC